MRTILFTGKGGVGKTTVACATAVAAAASGRRTLIMSSDPAHSVADALGCALTHEPTEIAPNLWAEQSDPQRRLEENWRDIQEHAVAFLGWAGLGDIEAEELSVIPGLDELFALADVKRHNDERRHDLLIVDCAPTGETLRLLSLPEIMSWYMDRVFPVERRIMGAVRPVARRMTTMPLPGDRVYAAVRRFYDRLDGVRAVLSDGARASVRLVVNAEHMVIAEARRTFAYLSLFGYRVDAVVVNKLLPDGVSDPFFTRWKQIQAGHLDVIERSFAPVPVMHAPLYERELLGRDLLARFGTDLYRGRDPAAVLYGDEPMTIARRNGTYVLSLRLPFATRADVELSTKGDELFVKLGSYRRTLALPAVLAARTPGAAALVDDRLEVHFEDREDGDDG